MKPVHEPWTITRSNASLYGVGRLSPADTSATQPYYDMLAEHPLAGASLGFYLPGSGSTMVASRIFLGVMVVEWKVRFTSIKPPNISRPLALPSAESEEALPSAKPHQVIEEPGVPKSARVVQQPKPAGHSSNAERPLTVASLTE